MEDYCDGQLYKQNKLFMEDPCALQIQLYYDEIEVCNPIGSFAKKHKLGQLMKTLNCIINRLNEFACHCRVCILHSGKFTPKAAVISQKYSFVVYSETCVCTKIWNRCHIKSNY